MHSPHRDKAASPFEPRLQAMHHAPVSLDDGPFVETPAFGFDPFFIEVAIAQAKALEKGAAIARHGGGKLSKLGVAALLMAAGPGERRFKCNHVDFDGVR